MDALALIDELEDMIDKGVPVPLSGKSLMSKEELMDTIQDLRNSLPDDLKQAKWIKEERQRILDEAEEEANKIIKSAEDQLVAMISEHEVTKKAIEHSNDILDKARDGARNIQTSSYQYADNLLENVERVLSSTMRDLDQCMSLVRENRTELR